MQFPTWITNCRLGEVRIGMVEENGEAWTIQFTNEHVCENFDIKKYADSCAWQEIINGKKVVFTRILISKEGARALGEFFSNLLYFSIEGMRLFPIKRTKSEMDLGGL